MRSLCDLFLASAKICRNLGSVQSSRHRVAAEGAAGTHLDPLADAVCMEDMSAGQAWQAAALATSSRQMAQVPPSRFTAGTGSALDGEA
eukprot:CAMPEP_0115153906 /NCGR_PEP_ID=MMETSP0227-20121206/66989_1 /TAXON_ID=89957 /ORGANISM="Polarella glacialis, Strain CCMP 1383" /LENGTH=88 /DNA_ID=CAMNT_0002564703 /DNA_START=247 /DNA_END=509 /DNA_ORIENTATION=-